MAVLPAGVSAVQGQDNRVAEPSAQDFVVITALRRERLETNVDTYADVSFNGFLTAGVLTVSSMILSGVGLLPGDTLWGTSVTAGTIIQSQISGTTGGVGTYQLSTTQTLGAAKYAAGNELLAMPVDLVFQLDVHGPNSPDNAQTIATLFRDDYATAWWIANGYLTSGPLYADDPRQMPFVNENQQVETRWIVEAHVQANMVITSPQQFADQLHPTLIEIAAAYTP